MLHGPCSSKCFVDGICEKSFPKPFAEETDTSTDSYPTYRRRNNGRTYRKPGCSYIFTNRDVVPYNPYLSTKYNAHINVEITSAIFSVKYLFKYVYKGNDRASMIVERENPEPVNEPKEYIDARYVSAAEACGHIFMFKMHGHDPTIVRLQLHLEFKQRCLFDPTQPAAFIAPPKTTLTEFFVACRQYPDIALGLTYPQFPQRFRWVDTPKGWVPRKRGFAIGRVYFCGPAAGEKYYLRMLLYTVPNPTSFQALRHYDTLHPYSTYKEACVARGLLESDSERDLCLEEAGVMQPGRQLRKLFATILVFNPPLNASELWIRHVRNLTDDCSYILHTQYRLQHPNEAQVLAYAIKDLDNILAGFDKSVAEFGFSEPDLSFLSDTHQQLPRLIQEELEYDCTALEADWRSSYQTVTDEKRHAFLSVIASVESKPQEI